MGKTGLFLETGSKQPSSGNLGVCRHKRSALPATVSAAQIGPMWHIKGWLERVCMSLDTDFQGRGCPCVSAPQHTKEVNFEILTSGEMDNESACFRSNTYGREGVEMKRINFNPGMCRVFSLCAGRLDPRIPRSFE